VQTQNDAGLNSLRLEETLSDEEEDEWDDSLEEGECSGYEDVDGERLQYCETCESDSESAEDEDDNEAEFGGKVVSQPWAPRSMDGIALDPLGAEPEFGDASCDCEDEDSFADPEAANRGGDESELEGPQRREDGFVACSHPKSVHNAAVKVWLARDAADIVALCDNGAYRGLHVRVKGIPGQAPHGGEGQAPPYPDSVFVPPRTEQHEVARVRIGTEKIAKALMAAEADFSWSYGWGDPKAVHNDKVRYALPYDGKSRHVCQGFGGKYSHKGNLHYSIDFDMPVGTPVRCARPGVVCSVRHDSERGGASRKYVADANYVNVLHADGTEGVYLHLRPNGVAVKLGKKVKKGTLIGYCGLTGFTSRPHVHFHVKLSGHYHKETKWKTVPILFKADMGHGGAKGLVPKQGKWYYNTKEHQARIVKPPWLQKKKKKKKAVT